MHASWRPALACRALVLLPALVLDPEVGTPAGSATPDTAPDAPANGVWHMASDVVRGVPYAGSAERARHVVVLTPLTENMPGGSDEARRHHERGWAACPCWSAAFRAHTLIDVDILATRNSAQAQQTPDRASAPARPASTPRGVLRESICETAVRVAQNPWIVNNYADLVEFSAERSGVKGREWALGGSSRLATARYLEQYRGALLAMSLCPEDPAYMIQGLVEGMADRREEADIRKEAPQPRTEFLTQ
ncbi:hypothetical protein GGX14DRAFT_391536 [Mycena pura]|uniref:Uncharacterized protein n=1 Tax=Mycena pura TaxID=153505 RepID=A0AAD6VKR1_9AGAR|nr:hypothetical protein GGX14DRAFT_391536 [Mycena pura]